VADHDDQYGFIQLNRTFHELPKNTQENAKADEAPAFLMGTRLTWSDLLKNYRTVVLSEAGSGKTEEIRQIALHLHGEGKAAFFLRLEHVLEDLENAFEVGDFAEFTTWLDSSYEAWLLLDSVDEARLRNPSDFERAIRKIGRYIQRAKDRAHILITGRSSAWRPKTDLDLCKQHLPFTPATTVIDSTNTDKMDDGQDEFDKGIISTEERDEQDAEPDFKIVALDDLSNEQIQIFAYACGIKDTKRFLDAIERADAESFTSRPQDLQELVEFWLDQGRIGTRLELMQNSIERRLQERDQNHADARPLSSQRAREGARLIAAAVTLAQEPTIQVPDGAHNNKGITLRLILPDWDERDQAALLSRPIFDEAIYGTVRFHHRSVREYLTAEWLAELLKRPASRHAVESLLFRNQYGVDVVVPTMRPILPWLAILDPRIRERLRRVAPEVVFEGGDPSALPLDTRRIVLAEVCEQIAGGNQGRSALDYSAVQRFASPDLADIIHQLLKKYNANDELLGFLLRMVWLGQLITLLPEAKRVSLSPSVSTYTRITAIRAVKAVGTKDDQKEMREAFISEASTLNRELLSELVTDTESSAETINWLLAALEKVERKERYSVDRLTDSVADFTSATPICLMPCLIAGLNLLLEVPPLVERGYCEVSQNNMWLMKAAANGVERLIRAKSQEAISNYAIGILYKFRAAQEWGTDVRDIKVDFAKLVSAWPELNRAALWYDVHRTRQALYSKRGTRLTSYWQASSFGAFWNFVPEDFDYLADAIETLPEQDDKLVALSLAFEQYARNDRPRAWFKCLKKLVQGNSELEKHLSDYLNPPKSEHAREENAWKKRIKAREKREREGHEKSKAYILSHVDALRNPDLPSPSDISRVQWYLHERLREKNNSSKRWTEGRWQELVPEYGEEVARAYRDGVVAYWRRYRPQLRSEGAVANSVPISVIFGLAGLNIEAAEVADWPATLTIEEVLLACRYATHELNGFPNWFPNLFEAHPDLVSDFLVQEIEYEVSVESPSGEVHYLLSDVSWSGQWAWDRLAPNVFQMLARRDSSNTYNLGKLLVIIQGSSVIPDADIAPLAERRAQSATSIEHAAIWFAVWVGVEPDRAVPALALHLRELSLDEEKKAFAMTFATRLWPDRYSHATGVRSAFHTPAHLKSLYLLMHTYIRRNEDIDRSGGGAYSPGLRDNAQDARNALFEQLNRIPGKEAYVALDEISKAHPDEAARPWFILHAKRKAERDADMQPWSPSQVREFHDYLDRTPTNHRDLANLAVLRLLDLKYDLEDADSSIAEILLKVDQETIMRNYLSHELREKAFGRYTIAQEEELADSKRPDLRFHGVAFDAPVPVELKLADKWTGPELIERLENQLSGDYLRDKRSAQGIFVLVYLGRKQGWEVPGSANRVGFYGLIEVLQRHWASIADKYPAVDAVTVIGIDLTRRFN
jgi:hypothetical protein